MQPPVPQPVVQRAGAFGPDAAAPARHGLVLELLVHGLGRVAAGPGASPTVLDCGGGSGSYAVPLARSGATVTVIDISIDALATLRRRADEAGAAARVTGVQGDVESLADLLPAQPSGGFDLVLAHGILEALESADRAFAAMAAAVRPNGLLSILVGNPAAAVLARALAGDLPGALRELDASDSRQVTPASVRDRCAEHGLVIEQVHGIGVFADIVPGAALDLPGGRDALARLEAACATRRPLAEIAGRVHLLARRPS